MMTAETLETGFGIEEEERDGAPVIRLRGELDLSTAEPLREALERAEARRPQAIVVDLTGVTFIDSSGAAAPRR
jgi:anti-anti-sigma factor